ncbi:MAG: hypothetical protein KDA20_07520 [Phycisphaerales bacterium]|nr:hypothetical protein [Phycisphaerales bacterium]
MFTYPNPFTFQNTYGVNTPWNTTPNFNGNFNSGYGWNWNTPQFGWNQYGWNTPNNFGWNNSWNWNTPYSYSNWNSTMPFNTGWNWNNWQAPVNGYEGFYGYNTPYFNNQFTTPFNWNTNWNSNTTPFPGLYNFSNTFGQGYPYNNFPFSNTTFAGYPYGNYSAWNTNSANASFPYAFGATPWMNGYNTPWNYGMPFFGNFGWNTPIGWNQPKVDDVVNGKKVDINSPQPNRVTPFPVGFGPFVPFGYPNGEFVKNCSPACAA